METNCVCQDRRAYTISIHSTTRVETISPLRNGPKAARFQSTPPRGWRQCLKLLEDEECRKFQSTPPRGWRHGDTKDEKWKQEISIHSTTRVETVVMIKLPLSYIISIHSTTRVETSVDIPTDILYLNFNPLHHEGGDPVIAGIKDEDTRFQSTPPRGWRHGMEPNEIGELLFQSTPPRGWRRILTAIPGVEDFISIHSTTRVETVNVPVGM